MNRKQLLAVLSGAGVFLLILALGGWLALSSYATDKAKGQIAALLLQYHLQQAVEWQSLSASPFGSVTLKQVRLPGLGWQAQQVKLSAIVDTAERKRLHMDIEGFTELPASKNLTPQTQWLGLASGRIQLPPADMGLQLDVRFDDDRADIKLWQRQKDTLDMDMQLELGGIRPLRELLDMPALSWQLGNPLQKLQQLGEGLKLYAFDGSAKDRGLIERQIILAQRYNSNLNAANDSIKEQQAKAFSEKAKASETECRESFGRLTEDPQQSCAAFIRFTAQQGQTLHLSANPQTPLLLADLLEIGSSTSPQQFAARLNLKVR